MAEDYKTITRVIEYHGPQEWLEATMAACRIPVQGVKQFQNGVYIKSGVLMWQPVEIEAAEGNKLLDSPKGRVDGGGVS